MTLRSTGPVSPPDGRARFSRLLTIFAARNVWRSIFSSSSLRGSPSSDRSSSICVKLEMPVSGVFTSWATPAASRPMAAIFSDRRSCSSRLARSVTSAMTRIQPACSPSGRCSGAIARFTSSSRCSPAAGDSCTRNSDVPSGASRRAAPIVSKNARWNSAAMGCPIAARALDADERFRAPVPQQHAVLEVHDHERVGQRFHDVGVELADALDFVRLLPQLAVEARVLDRRGRLARHGGEQAQVFAAERLAMRAAADGDHGNRQVARHARHEAEEPRLAPRRPVVSDQPARGRGVVDRHRLTVLEPGGQPRRRFDGGRRRGRLAAGRANHEAAGFAPRIGQEQRDAIDAQRLGDAIDEALAQAVEVEVRVEVAREAQQRAAIVVAIAVVQPVQAGLNRSPQPRRHQRDDERGEERPETAAIRSRRRAGS